MSNDGASKSPNWSPASVLQIHEKRWSQNSKGNIDESACRELAR